MSKQVNYITNRLKLRDPQKESLEIFSTICNELELAKDIKLETEEGKIKDIINTFESFERSFPSICFSLATGVGKTRLMGAFIAYMYYCKNIKNFFVMAPNITIYNKLIGDFGNINSPKYVFKGLDAFVTAPRIINGDNYEDFRNTTLDLNEVTINIFNIAKLNAETKSKKGQPPKIKRLNEVLGESYFDYLKSLDDLVLLMDESHHYRADASFKVINELNPILGIEVTATPQIQGNGKIIKFKNVVYEYSLAHALEDGKFIKIPAVATRENFINGQYNEEELDKLKLHDGVQIHIETKAEIEKYARENCKKLIKPFILVVAKDTDHSKKIKNYITSDSFFKGYYKDKVLEINSNQSGSEKDENINHLLSLEDMDNKIEIVVHVNMLKEGWDVNNLYTIIPLRASASQTLTEQTIGRGLRLPYGERTGVERLDLLTIVHHDKFEDIISLANDPNSLVRRVYYINPEDVGDANKEVIGLQSKVEDILEQDSFLEEINSSIDNFTIEEDTKLGLTSFMVKTAHNAIMEISKVVKNINDIKKPEYQSLISSSIKESTRNLYESVNVNEECFKEYIIKVIDAVSELITDNIIPIPQGTIQQKLEIVEGFYDFNLDTRNINYRPSEEVIKIKDLSKNSNTSYINTFKNKEIYDTPENEIVKFIILEKSDVNYEKSSKLLYKLISQLKNHFSTYLNDDEVTSVLVQRKNDLAEIIYNQMKEHFYKEEIHFEASEMRPFSKIEMSYASKYQSENIYDYRTSIKASKVKEKVFRGFKKNCHSLCKFDSNTEKIFATILEDDKSVLRWLRPSQKQFKIYWDRESKHNYQPDFIVETVDTIYMIETKDSTKVKIKDGEIINEEVRLKGKAGMEYCKAATEFNLKYKGKPWIYVLISHNEVQINRSFNWLVGNAIINPCGSMLDTQIKLELSN